MSLVALGVTGGIGAYKAVEIARGLQKRGHEVIAIMTRSARRFVGPLTFEAITRRRVITDQWSPGTNADIEHISIATDIALLLVAPATANTIGRFAGGIADDFLSSLYLATRAPVLMAPAMNTQMLAHPAVTRRTRRSSFPRNESPRRRRRRRRRESRAGSACDTSGGGAFRRRNAGMRCRVKSPVRRAAARVGRTNRSRCTRTSRSFRR